MATTTKAARAAGVAVPLGALKTAHSCGIGEFPDLEAFADWCAGAGLKLIQLLPVNDTGDDSSPYSARSAFALNPVYISLEKLPEYAPGSAAAKRMDALRREDEALSRFSYSRVRDEKLAALRSIYDGSRPSPGSDAEFAAWLAASPWVPSYAVYTASKKAHGGASWTDWGAAERSMSEKDIAARWEAPALKAEHLFYAWMQFRAHQQFKAASSYAAGRGVFLKGDIPILMNEDSCDVWAHPEFFDRSMRAGAPPDMYNPAGQNWRFPVYNWEAMRKTGFSWWKERLKCASAYYQGFRIDHVLGFFRIFKIPEADVTAYLGRPDPLVPVTEKELAAAGFSAERIRWLSEPHVPTGPCVEANGGDYLGTHGALSRVMDRIGTEELWLFKAGIKGERDILASDLPQGIKDTLFRYWHNRALVRTAPGAFYPAWTREDTAAWQSLSEEEKTALDALFAKKNKAMEKLWEAQGKALLESAVLSQKKMTAFAEDLGVNFKAVPKTLKALGIYSLRVVRWERDYGAEGAPFIPLKKYPPLSVTAASVHDSSPARLWWEREGEAAAFAEANKAPEAVLAAARAGSYPPEAARWFMETAAGSASGYFVCPVQDFLALTETYRAADAADERINVPGTVNGFNWTYRLPAPIETLRADKALSAAIAAVVKKRG